MVGAMLLDTNAAWEACFCTGHYLRCTWGSLFLVPCSLFLVPGSWFLVLGSWFKRPPLSAPLTGSWASWRLLFLGMAG